MKRKIRNLSEKAITLARSLRKGMTLSERRLWRVLRHKNLGFKFRRQHPAGPYVLDFYCPQVNLCVELDGDPHFWKETRDARRDLWLAERGIRTVRLTTHELNKSPEGALQKIWRVCVGEE